MTSEAKTRMAILLVHSQNYSSLRKRSYKKACRHATDAQQPVAYRGQQLTPLQVRRAGNCPPRHPGQRQSRPPRPRAGLANKDIHVLSWNAGHLGQQQWAEMKSWLQTEGKDVGDILILHETHWQASAEFTTSGWYYVSSASACVSTEAAVGAGGPGHTAPKEGARPVKTHPESARAAPRSLQLRGQMASWFWFLLRCRLTPYVGRSMCKAGSWRSDSTGMELGPLSWQCISTSGPRQKHYGLAAHELSDQTIMSLEGDDPDLISQLYSSNGCHFLPAVAQKAIGLLLGRALDTMRRSRPNSVHILVVCSWNVKVDWVHHEMHATAELCQARTLQDLSGLHCSPSFAQTVGPAALSGTRGYAETHAQDRLPNLHPRRYEGPTGNLQGLPP